MNSINKNIKLLLPLLLILQLQLPLFSQSMRWIPTPQAIGACPSKPGAKEKTLSYVLEYTPGVSGVLTSYTTGFLVSCTTAGSAIVKNQSRIMSSKTREISGCNTMGAVLMNSSGNSGQIVVHAGDPVILHQICLSIPPGESITVQEEVVTDLTTSIDLGNGAFTTEFPTYESITIGKAKYDQSKPMLLLDFKGRPAGDFVAQLDWSTPHVDNNSPFVIERSTDGVEFATIGTMDVDESTDQIITYQFIDKDAAPGDNHYRLNQVNTQDINEYSPIRIVSFKPTNLLVTYAPNPADDFFEVNFQSSGDINSFRLMDASGRVVLDKKIENRVTKFNVETKKLSPGIYLLEVVSGNDKFSDKVVISH